MGTSKCAEIIVCVHKIFYKNCIPVPANMQFFGGKRGDFAQEWAVDMKGGCKFYL